MVVISLRLPGFSDEEMGRDLANTTKYRKGGPESYPTDLSRPDPSLLRLTPHPQVHLGEGVSFFLVHALIQEIL